MNTSELEHLLYIFHQISGMEVAIVDGKYRNILSKRCAGRNFCAYVHQSTKCLDTCIQSDVLHLHLVDEKQKLLTYICPFGIFEAIAPIKKNGRVVAYLFFAMGIEEREGCDELPVHRVLESDAALDEEELQRCLAEIPHYSRKKLEAYSELLSVLAEYIEKNDLMEDSERSIGRLIQSYIKKNLHSKITLADLSWNLHCSTVTLTEHFKREFGMTIMQYVTQQRMELAEQMLLAEDLSINEIATACGFMDIEYFSRTFKTVHGVSPSRWRRDRKDGHREDL